MTVALAEAALKTKKYEQANVLYEQALAQGEDPKACHLGLAMSDYYLGHLDAAMNNAGKALAEEPRLAKAYLVRAYVSARKGETEACKADIESALQLDPADPEILSFAGGVLLVRSNIDPCIELLQKAAVLNAGDWMVPFSLGRAYGLKQDYGQALHYYGRSYALSRSWTTLKMILWLSVYKYRFVLLLVLSVLAFLSYPLRSISLLFVSVLPVLGMGVWEVWHRIPKGWLLIFLAGLPVLLYLLFISAAK